LCSIFFRCHESTTIHLKKEHAYDETRPLVSVHKTMISHDARHTGSCHIDDVRGFTIREELAGPRQCGLQESGIVNASRSALQGEETIMNRQDVAFVYPDGFIQLASTCKVLR